MKSSFLRGPSGARRWRWCAVQLAAAVWITSCASCPAGTRTWPGVEGCMPSDPCGADVACAELRRTCVAEGGAAVCDRCIDGHLEIDGECVPRSQPYVGPYVVGRDTFAVWDSGRYRSLFLRGLNVAGTAPGDYADDCAVGVEQWLEWMELWADAGLNSVRLYRLLQAPFYDALVQWNEAHPEAPLYLVQGIYLEEEHPDDESADLYLRAERFDALLDSVIDCVHGACEGYPRDASPWVLAWLPGREVAAHEMIETRAAHPEITSYRGGALSIEPTDAATAWIVERMDRMVSYEREHFRTQRPIGFSSWPELDPIEHPSERDATRQDVVSLDLTGVDTSHAPAGHFVSYHVYPYFPDFVNEDPVYRTWLDPEGNPAAYRAYLAALREHHRDQAVLISEFGVPSSWGRAHPSASGMPHGGLDEREQGEAAIRMLRDIESVGAAGGIWFQWEDGWFKGAWANALRAFPRDRYPLWHDLLCPEQSYGLLAYEESAQLEPLALRGAEASPIASVRVGHTSAALVVRVELTRDVAPHEPLELALDVLDPARGEPAMVNGAVPDARPEVDVRVDPSSRDAHLYTSRCLDLARVASGPRPEAGYRTQAGGCGGWELARWIMVADHDTALGEHVPEQPFDLGRLRVRRAGDTASSLDAVIVERRAIELRLPWNLLLVADPSARTVIDDDPATYELEATVTDGIALAVSIGGALVQTERYAWPTWDVAPATTMRLKESAQRFFDYTRTLPRYVD